MRQLILEKENSEFKPIKRRLKIVLVSYSARAETLVNMDYEYFFIKNEDNNSCQEFMELFVGWLYRVATLVGLFYGEANKNSLTAFFSGPPHMDGLVLADQ